MKNMDLVINELTYWSNNEGAQYITALFHSLKCLTRSRRIGIYSPLEEVSAAIQIVIAMLMRKWQNMEGIVVNNVHFVDEKKIKALCTTIQSRCNMYHMVSLSRTCGSRKYCARIDVRKRLCI